VEVEQQPGLAEQLARDAAGQAARHLARQALTKLATLVGAKASLIVIVVIAVIVAVVLLVVVIVSVAGAAFQSSTAVWPVSVKTDTAGNYQASGWTISSRFGWRDDLQGGGAEFHDGLDLANPNGSCPFGYHCGAPAMFDGRIEYVGWDVAAAGDPSKTGGGEMVIMQNGEDDHQTIYAHLEPYRLYVQLQGRIEDAYGRYDDYRDYQPIGQGPLRPDLSNGGIEMTCLNDMPNFIPTRSGRGTVVFMYDRPATCTTTVVWGQRGGDWQGWIPDQPRGRDGQRADLHWQTPIDPGQHAQDVALRFRAHLVPPPPPPPITATTTLTPEPGAPLPSSVAARGGLSQPGRGSTMLGQPGGPITTTAATIPTQAGTSRSCATLAGGWTRCAWSFADIPTERQRFEAAPDPWIVAVQTVTRTHPLIQDDEDGPTLSPASAQDMPVESRALAPVATPTPAASSRIMPAAMPPGVGGINRQGALEVDATPTPTLSQRSLSATLDPPAIRFGATTTLRIGVTGNSSETPAYLIVALPNYGGLRLAPTLPPECYGTAILITCPVPVPSDISIPLELRDARGAFSLDMTVMLMPTHNEPEQRQSLELQVVQDTPTPVPPSATPVLPSASTTPIPPSGPGSTAPDCASQPLVQLPNVTAPNPRLIAPAAASFAAVRAEILERTGVDALAVLGDVLRQPSFTTSKPGVLQASWHKAGRAIDLNQGGPFLRVAESNRFRLYVNNVDITAIFESHGWQRIPVQGDTAEWWHYEWHPDGIAWTSAMRQVWDLRALQAAFPEIAWSTIGCASGSNSTGGDQTTNPLELEGLCVLGAPSYRSAVETFAGCGPPIRAGDKVYQLDSTLGFVGLTGRTTGPHLHLGLKVKSYDGSWPTIDICTPEWLQGRTPPADVNCFTDLADPLAFLPQAPGNTGVGGDEAPVLRQLGNNRNLSGAVAPTPIIPEGAPYQLPPPNYPGALVFTPVPDATPNEI